MVDGQYGVHEFVEGPSQMRVGNLVANLAAFGNGNNEPAAAKAAEVIGDVRAREPQVVGEFGRVCRVVEQRQ
jgi:hypothetical protein